EDSRLVPVAALPLEQFFGLVAAVAPEVGMQQVHHRPEMTALLDVHLKEIAEVVQAGTALTEPPLLLDTGRLRITLGDDQPSQLIPEFPGYVLPDRTPHQIAKPNAAIVDGIGEKDAPSIFRQPDVLEMWPAFRIDADGRPHVHLVMVLESLRAHVAPPLQVLGLPVLERALEPLVAREVDVIGYAIGGNHEPASRPVPVELRPTLSTVCTERAVLADRVRTLKDPVLPGAQAAEDLRLHRLRTGKTQVRLETGQRVGRQCRARFDRLPHFVIPIHLVRSERHESGFSRIGG